MDSNHGHQRAWVTSMGSEFGVKHGRRSLATNMGTNIGGLKRAWVTSAGS